MRDAPIVVLGLDIASTTGWGVVSRHKSRERLDGHGLVNAREDRNIRAFISDLWEAHGDLTHVFIESTYIARGKRANPAMTVQLAQKAGAFRYALSERCPVRFVEPAKWRSDIINPPGGLERDELKALAVGYCKLAFGLVLGIDEAEAVCISLFGVRRQLFGG